MNCSKCAYSKYGASNPDSAVCEQCMKNSKMKSKPTPTARYNNRDGHEEVVQNEDDH